MSKVARRVALAVQAQEVLTAVLAADGVAVPVPACARCAQWADGREVLEQRIAGLRVFSSGFGASVADSRLCLLHDRLVSPEDACERFVPRA